MCVCVCINPNGLFKGFRTHIYYASVNPYLSIYLLICACTIYTIYIHTHTRTRTHTLNVNVWCGKSIRTSEYRGFILSPHLPAAPSAAFSMREEIMRARATATLDTTTKHARPHQPMLCVSECIVFGLCVCVPDLDQTRRLMENSRPDCDAMVGRGSFVAAAAAGLHKVCTTVSC